MEIANKAEFNASFRRQLQQTEQLPPLPETARQLLILRNKKDAQMDDLIKIIKQDPSLTAQILRYGRQAIYGYGDRIKEVKEAVALVMGFDVALHFCLGISSGKTLQCTNTGPLSRTMVWQQALECASLCQLLAPKCRIKNKPNAGLSYLAGLFHNFGYLLFGHLHPEEYAHLNKIVERYPHTEIRAIELHSFGISHDMIGMELMRAWNMPEEIVHAVAEHHFPDYDGEHALYGKLVALSNRLMEKPGMQDNSIRLPTDKLLEQLNITEKKAEEALIQVRSQQEEFVAMAQTVAA